MKKSEEKLRSSEDIQEMKITKIFFIKLIMDGSEIFTFTNLMNSESIKKI